MHPPLGRRPAAARAATRPCSALLSVSARRQGQPSRTAAQPRGLPALQQQQRRRQQQQRGRVACEAEPTKACPITGAAAAGKPFRDEDRLSKYGWGSLRLGLLLGLALAAAPQLSAAPEAAAAATASYLHSLSIAGHATIGAAGALVSEINMAVTVLFNNKRLCSKRYIKHTPSGRATPPPVHRRRRSTRARSVARRPTWLC